MRMMRRVPPPLPLESNDVPFWAALVPSWLISLYSLLPHPVHYILSNLFLLEHVQGRAINNNGYVWLFLGMSAVTLLAIWQLRAFARPPLVALKRLPRRPIVTLLFQPDDITTSQVLATKNKQKQQQTATTTTQSKDGFSNNNNNNTQPWRRRLGKSLQSVSSQFLKATGSLTGNNNNNNNNKSSDDDEYDYDGDHHNRHGLRPSSRRQNTTATPITDGTSSDDDFFIADEEDIDDDDDDESHDHPAHTAAPSAKPNFSNWDMPDSFAPLLSSSHVEVLKHQLTADLIHGVKAEATIRMRDGRHEIPLDKDGSRPQLTLEVPKSGCKLSAIAMIGSDRLSIQDDLNVSIPTLSRSKPMVKNAGLVFDPPLPLLNVAPTLIHFPTLFEDVSLNHMQHLRIVRLFINLIVSLSSFIEKCLWIVESKCQIHLSKIQIRPLYKGRQQEQEQKEAMNGGEDHSAEWRLRLSFSGHLLLWGWIPIPFINIVLPTFVIPQPHALLDHLLTEQPLASAKVRRELIAEQRIALALLNTADAFAADVKVVATPPAMGVDITLPGGLAVAMELGLGRDPLAGQSSRMEADSPTHGQLATRMDTPTSDASMSSWTTRQENVSGVPHRATSGSIKQSSPFDANQLVPWFLDFQAKGTLSHDKMSVRVIKCTARHEELVNGFPVVDHLSTRGNLAVWKLPPGSVFDGGLSPIPLARRVPSLRRRNSNPALDTDDTPSVAAVLLFPEETETYRQDQRMLKYDYSFDVSDDSKIDAITLSVGATHMMLNGGTMMTFILENLFAFGTFAARDDAVLDPIERHRKRNILRHLPAADFAAGVQNIYIPPESNSYSDDGLTLFVPIVDGGRLQIRILGGLGPNEDVSIGSQGGPVAPAVAEGIMLIADVEVPSLLMNTEGVVKEFPELDIFEGVKLRTHLSGIISGSVRTHLRPQQIPQVLSSTGPNIFNPLEAYEIDCAGSSMVVKVKEYTATLGHRRVVFPAESTVTLQIIESVVDMGFEGKTRCELGWDFQGLSPILQVTKPGVSPEDADPEQKEQVSLLIGALRQGKLSLNVSPVGGITVKQATTAREDKEGLFDWKFFNALVSPDEDSIGRLMDVIHDKRTTDRILQIAKLISSDLHRILKFVLEQVWKFKKTLDLEGVKEARDALPSDRMACIITRFVTGDIVDVGKVLPMIERIVQGDGLDISLVKDLLREHIPETYHNWSPEIDRAVRWAALMCGPVAAAQPYVEENVIPLEELPHYAARLKEIPSAQVLYEKLLDKPHMPLDPVFSNLVGHIAPYLSFRQIEFFLEARAASDWQPEDLRRIRYVYSIKRKVLDIAESYGGLSFLPQSFLVSVFLGEATRTSLRASFKKKVRRRKRFGSPRVKSRPFRSQVPNGASTLSSLRGRRGLGLIHEYEGLAQTPAERAANLRNFDFSILAGTPENVILDLAPKPTEAINDVYELGDSLLGPQDVAILLQAGLTSVMKASTVVQLNQRMILDLICSQPHTFAIAVLAEIGSTGSPRGLTSALMALLELDQTAFKPEHKVDMHSLLESWLPGLSIPRRDDFLAGGRWARQSYYEALYSVATSILGEAEMYSALKGHIQRVHRCTENDPIPSPRENPDEIPAEAVDTSDVDYGSMSRLKQTIRVAKSLIAEADQLGSQAVKLLQKDEKKGKDSKEYTEAVRVYREAFEACAKARDIDKHAFHARWFREFYKRNLDALMIKSMYDNMIDDVDNIRYWLHVLRTGARRRKEADPKTVLDDLLPRLSLELDLWMEMKPSRAVRDIPEDDDMFLQPEKHTEQELIDAIIDAIVYEEADRGKMREDPLVRLLLDNPTGHYNFTVVSAMGVVTEGKKGTELSAAFQRLEKKRGVKVIRSDTATVRSLEYNAGKIEEAIEEAIQLGKPYGYIGYSQGCANALLAESTLLTGTPKQQQALTSSNAGLVCRMLCFSAANGSIHGPSMERKIERLIVLCEEFFKYQQGYVSRALTASILENINNLLDSASFHKLMGGAQCFLPDGCRLFWREAQHLSTVPTCTLRGVMEDHTTPEALEMMRALMTKQSGSPLHDSQVHVFDAVGHPVYYHNRNGRILQACEIGNGAVQRTHHWSPLGQQEVGYIQTTKDIMMASYDCAKDRHVIPWVEVNARFGFIKYANNNNAMSTKSSSGDNLRKEVHASILIQNKQQNKEKR